MRHIVVTPRARASRKEVKIPTQYACTHAQRTRATRWIAIDHVNQVTVTSAIASNCSEFELKSQIVGSIGFKE